MMPDSNAIPPVPPDDDDAIDFGQLEPVEEGASASVSFTGRSGPKSGSSILTWQELVRQQDGEHVDYERIANDGIDPDSDKDLLNKVLADEPPPSDIIYKDPSNLEMPA